MDIYSEIILDHYKHPHNQGRLEHPGMTATVLNPLCGDVISLDATLDEHGKIETIGYESKGCAISTAAMSMVSDMVIGKTREDILDMTIESIQDMLGVQLSPSRLKCALLSQEALTRAFETKE